MKKWLAYEKGISSGGASVITSSDGGGDEKTSMDDIWHGDMHHTSGMAATSAELEGDNYHTHMIAGAAHSHTVIIEDHTHEINIPEHSHDINYGIFEFDNLPSSVIIKVDGNITPYTELSGKNIDIVPYLKRDLNGNIERGWHQVEIFPQPSENNPNGLARINASVVKKVFVQSRGEYTL